MLANKQKQQQQLARFNEVHQLRLRTKSECGMDRETGARGCPLFSTSSVLITPRSQWRWETCGRYEHKAMHIFKTFFLFLRCFQSMPMLIIFNTICYLYDHRGPCQVDLWKLPFSYVVLGGKTFKYPQTA